MTLTIFECRAQTSFRQNDSILSPVPDKTEIEFWGTYYCIPHVQHTDSGIAILDQNEEETGLKLSSCDWCQAAIEGTVLIQDGASSQLYNYTGRSSTLQTDCRLCNRFKKYDGYDATGKVLWEKSSGFGKGVENYNLVPFRTIAVDPNIIPYGMVIYIAELDGVKYVDENGMEQVHDGNFFAGDTGSEIRGNHIDFFIGSCVANPLTAIVTSPGKTFSARKTWDKNIIKRLSIRHIP